MSTITDATYELVSYYQPSVCSSHAAVHHHRAQQQHPIDDGQYDMNQQQPIQQQHDQHGINIGYEVEIEESEIDDNQHEQLQLLLQSPQPHQPTQINIYEQDALQSSQPQIGTTDDQQNCIVAVNNDQFQDIITNHKPHKCKSLFGDIPKPRHNKKQHSSLKQPLPPPKHHQFDTSVHKLQHHKTNQIIINNTTNNNTEMNSNDIVDSTNSKDIVDSILILPQSLIQSTPPPPPQQQHQIVQDQQQLQQQQQQQQQIVQLQEHEHQIEDTQSAQLQLQLQLQQQQQQQLQQQQQFELKQQQQFELKQQQQFELKQQQQFELKQQQQFELKQQQQFELKQQQQFEFEKPFELDSQRRELELEKRDLATKQQKQCETQFLVELLNGFRHDLLLEMKDLVAKDTTQTRVMLEQLDVKVNHFTTYIDVKMNERIENHQLCNIEQINEFKSDLSQEQDNIDVVNIETIDDQIDDELESDLLIQAKNDVVETNVNDTIVDEIPNPQQQHTKPQFFHRTRQFFSNINTNHDNIYLSYLFIFFILPILCQFFIYTLIFLYLLISCD